ncbi:PhzF family phenazine biosynthesis protein [Xanthovirga aplysinae]|uniref:PhzF family phenazine biosynthesis protein n=1 Tax=Xanthovirga aplysinae TaxID=2529853 RepID=UPI0012BBB8E7|nr:PhzF family phenazine biosynthesis protein [Xanthovirga aplysinae]MTI31991.1 PhzF family phenazine biosynthesis protein [Xanthovirga aplysinae]
MTNIQRIAAFSDNNKGGNPAGVVIGNEMPVEKEMLSIAKKVGYSETAFLSPLKDGWRIRYFAPEKEVPFCGHATIASGAALGERLGPGRYKLFLNKGEISLEVSNSVGGSFLVTLQSPETWSENAPTDLVNNVLSLFNWTRNQLDPNFPIRIASAGARHLILFLKEKETLSNMNYGFEEVKALMLKEDLTTISFLWAESSRLFHSRNSFASGGVYEDPATGAAAAALAGYLRDIDWKGESKFEILQGEDMGCPSRLHVEFTKEEGASIKLMGETRKIKL